MHIPRIIPLLLASAKLAVSLPAPMPILSFEIEKDEGEGHHQQRIQQSLDDVNEMLVGIHHDIHTAKPGEKSEEADRLEQAFGPNWHKHHDDLKAGISKMKDGTLKVGNTHKV
ncbi:hypothetical protein CPB86DRAFT_817973 [Serendipita vermifera]|nr:hypothetical protein CPB86DRAFT_817973 [Serendipita vermifera]